MYKRQTLTQASSPTKQQAKHIRLSRSPSSFRTSSKKAVSSTRLCNLLILIYNYNRTTNGRLNIKSAVLFSSYFLIREDSLFIRETKKSERYIAIVCTIQCSGKPCKLSMKIHIIITLIYKTTPTDFALSGLSFIILFSCN